ncbi:hypothetical protein KDH_56870 [Dictyobacter sp. S3.2.2.5]|uniref:Uncharacterized protein n=1 Tax=Dictyobacter halimunensis TaxID=3026934 RepID=A0ABQ6FX54_9CHLR|nr:hypothetical protein KDH_56870 [Dictyobacter sp. S3.2.2.5]
MSSARESRLSGKRRTRILSMYYITYFTLNIPKLLESKLRQPERSWKVIAPVRASAYAAAHIL